MLYVRIQLNLYKELERHRAHEIDFTLFIEDRGHQKSSYLLYYVLFRTHLTLDIDANDVDGESV